MSILPKPHPRSGCFISGQRPEIKWHISALRLSLYPEGMLTTGREQCHWALDAFL
jgi:hypothetical protein